MNLAKIPAGRNPPKDINVLIEISAGGLPVKCEMDKESWTKIGDWVDVAGAEKLIVASIERVKPAK